ncbi:hypothetical protein LCGC14_0808300 [marine sediment metagenome]|uniref:Fervidolysin-like N-terminal prodomain domain-containing protein n=1 Tax=marine sediment metagenome TaxID=412755 RepID=A0A0F9Q7K8_9ZZZZ
MKNRKELISLISIITLIFTMFPPQAFGGSTSVSDNIQPNLVFPKLILPDNTQNKKKTSTNNKKPAKKPAATKRVIKKRKVLNKEVRKKRSTNQYRIKFSKNLTSKQISIIIKKINRKYKAEVITKIGKNYVVTPPKGVSYKQIQNDINKIIKSFDKKESVKQYSVSFSKDLTNEQIDTIIKTINEKYKTEVLKKGKDSKYILTPPKGISFKEIEKEINEIIKSFFKEEKVEIDPSQIGYMFSFENVSYEEISSIADKNGITILYADKANGKYLLNLPSNMTSEKALEIFNSSFTKIEVEPAPSAPEYQEGVLIVKFREGTTPDEIDEINAKYSTSVKELISDNKGLTYLLNINEDASVEDKVAQFKAEESVEYAEPNYIRTTNPPQNDDPGSTQEQTVEFVSGPQGSVTRTNCRICIRPTGFSRRK